MGLICGGFPCQDLSVAGKRAGLAGERSRLWFEFARVIDELEPQWVVIENVTGLLSSGGGKDFGVIIRWLAARGYGVAWRVLDAQYQGRGGKQRVNMEESYKLYRCNCFDLMRSMPDKSVDVIITDPPYDERTHVGAVTSVEEGEKKYLVNELDFGHMQNHAEFVRECLRIARRWVLAFSTFEDIGKYSHEAYKYSAWVRCGVWDRVNPAPQFTGDRPSQAADGIAIMHPSDLKKRWNGGGKAAIWRYSVEFGRKLHPTQKPLSLMKKLVYQFSDADEIIFDPFMGVGTTAVAALQLGRRFIGSELSQKYFDIAEERIKKTADEIARRPELIKDAQDPSLRRKRHRSILMPLFAAETPAPPTPATPPENSAKGKKRKAI